MNAAALAVLSAAFVAVIVIYMRRPLFRTVSVSVARFLADLPDPAQSRYRWSLAVPLRSPSFWLQLGVVGLLLAAVVLESLRVTGMERMRMGVWLLVDTSYSMTVRQEGGTRLDLARAAAEQVIGRAGAAPSGGGGVCFRVSSFDLRRAERLDSGGADSARAALAGLVPQPAGTSLSAALGAVSAPAPEGCPITHVVVVSDQPVPAVPSDAGRSLIWLDIGRPAGNIGIAAVDAQRDAFTGAVWQVTASVQAWGEPPPDAQASIHDPDGRVVGVHPADWSPYGPWRVVFEPGRPGTYRITLSPSGAYDGDDTAEVEVESGSALQVDWRLPDRQIPARLGWEAGAARPTLKVVNDPAQAGPEPTLIVGPGYRGGAPSRVDLFADRHPVLAGVNFDVLDGAGMPPARLPAGFRPIAADTTGNVWVAVREKPRAVFIPGLPSAGSTPPDNAAMLVFFNAVRWLLAGEPSAVPVRWRSPAGVVIDSPVDEGNTGGEPRSHGTLDDLVPRPAGDAPVPLWPYLAAAASLLFAAERIHAAMRWRDA